MTKHGLTRRQSQLLGFIAEYSSKHGCSPSYVEMAQEMGISGVSAIHQHVTRLEERGHITRLPGQSRSICVVRHGARP